MSTRRRRPDTLVVVKDLLTFGVGLGLIIREGWFVQPQDFNLMLLLFGGALVQVPGAAALLALRTGGSRWQAQPQEPPPRSPSSSITSDAEP